MSFRVVVIRERAKLDLRLNYLICRGEDEKQIFIPEISTLVVESTAVSFTCSLMSALIKNNVKIIFCDEKHNPESELVGYYNNFHSVKKIEEQIAWNNSFKALLWREIIKQKIINQQKLLEEKGFKKESELLKTYAKEIETNDATNREGHSAKVYFNAICGTNFQRRDQSNINSALNYGYAILLSMFNREIKKCGYLTELGIWHKNEFNQFNLSSDLMEPFRILVDRIVFNFTENDEENFKHKVLEIVNLKIKINNKEQYLENAISIYCQSIFDCLKNDDLSELKFYEL